MKPDTERLRELLEKATLGPWEADRAVVYVGRQGGLEVDGCARWWGFDLRYVPRGEANAALIAELRNQAPALLDALTAAEARADKAEAERDELRAAIDAVQGDVGPNLWRFWQQKCKGYITRAADAEDRAEAAEAQVARLTEAVARAKTEHKTEVLMLKEALHDAINRPKGVVPASAEPFYDSTRAALEGAKP
jgi:DNA repair exonuclease SbcCD ATPase subunit